MTLFSFDEDKGLSEHFAPFDAFIQVIGGEMIFMVKGVKHIIRNGESFIFPAGARHSVKADKRFKMIITMVRKTETDKVKFPK